MTRWRLRKGTSLLLLSFFVLCAGAGAQEMGPMQVESMVHEPEKYPAPRNGAGPTGQQWDALESGDAFSYRDVQEFMPIERPETAPPPRESFISKLFDAIVRFFSGTAGVVLLWALLVAIIVFVIYRIIGAGGLRRRYRAEAVPDGDGSAEEEDLSADWETRMRTAASAGNLRLAVRCGYMRYLQVLQDAGEIRYRQDKTNAAYHRELGDEGQRAAFRQMSRQYEFAWYGHYEPSPAAYEAFVHLLNSTKSRYHAA